jgi:hypothetical protein
MQSRDHTRRVTLAGLVMAACLVVPIGVNAASAAQATSGKKVCTKSAPRAAKAKSKPKAKAGGVEPVWSDHGASC